MEMKTLVVTIMTLLSAILIVPNITQAQLGDSMREEEDSIRAMWARFEEFYNKNDADGLVTLFEEDADRFTSQGEVGHGRAEIRKQ